MQIPIILVGLGNIGGTLLRQILETREVQDKRTGMPLMPIAVADVSGALIDLDGLPDETLEAAQAATADGGLLNAMEGIRPLDELHGTLRPGAILADMTATPKTVPTLRAALNAECGVVLANKIPLAGSWKQAQLLLDHPNLRYECTVGAGLPVIDTLHYLLDTGDQVTTIEGCLSGTLGYLCAELERGTPYSKAVAQARELGYTEPDPRDDLSGKDVARKALILARTAGWPLEEDNLAIEPMYDDALAKLSIDEFLETAQTMDRQVARRVAQAKSAGQVLRYVARVSPTGGTVGLTAVDRDGPLGALRGPANYVALYTSRYDQLPLAISGPGAGPQVTAAGVMGDVIKLARHMR